MSGRDWVSSEIAERAVLGSALLDPKAFEDAAKLINYRDFYSEHNALIFRTIGVLHEANKPHDAVTVAEDLYSRGELDRVGGIKYLGELAANTACSANAVHYARSVAKTATLRRLQHGLRQTERLALSGADLTQVRDFLVSITPAATLATTETEKRRIIRGADLALKPIEWLVKGILSQGDSVVIFGASNTLKSFVVLDLALSVATGTPWHGQEVIKGVVVIFAPEGQRGLPRRRSAWFIARGLDSADSLDYVSTLPADLTSPESSRELAEELERVRGEAGAISVIVFDTWAKNFGPGDENSTQDTSAALAAAEALARPYGATVIFVHHTGHGDQGRARGAYALKAGVDLEYRVTRQEGAMALTLECTKAKDFEPPETMSFEARVVDLGEVDEFDQPVTSLSLTRTNYQPADQRGTGMGKNQANALRVLREMYAERRRNLQEGGRPPEGALVDVNEWREASGMPANRFKEASQGLQERGLVETRNGYAYPSE